MGIVFKRILSFVVPAILFLLAGVRLALDVIGWSTAPDDVEVARDRTMQILTWIASLPSWLPIAAASGLTAWLMYTSWPRPAQIRDGASLAKGPALPSPAPPGSDWAAGLRAICIRDAACAFAGVAPSEWGNSSRAQAIATDLLSQTTNGFIGTPEDYVSKGQGGRIVHVGRPPFDPKNSLSVDTIIDVRSLAGFALERPVNVDWLLGGNTKIFSAESIKALEEKRGGKLPAR